MSKLMKQIVDNKSIDYLQELFTISSNSVYSLNLTLTPLKEALVIEVLQLGTTSH